MLSRRVSICLKAQTKASGFGRIKQGGQEKEELQVVGTERFGRFPVVWKLIKKSISENIGKVGGEEQWRKND
jgi:hypothetical protein